LFACVCPDLNEGFLNGGLVLEDAEEISLADYCGIVSGIGHGN
jgi:hypothetical protein